MSHRQRESGTRPEDEVQHAHDRADDAQDEHSGGDSASIEHNQQEGLPPDHRPPAADYGNV
jgi:hypothetical protein